MPVEIYGDVNDKLKCRLGYALIRGYGIEKDEVKGWELIKSSGWHIVFLKERNVAEDYFQYRAAKDGYNDLDSYCDKLYEIDDDDSSFLFEYLLQRLGFDPEKDKEAIYDYYLKRANSGNAFSMAVVAVLELQKNNIKEAETWARRSKNKGSGLGKWIMTNQFQ